MEGGSPLRCCQPSGPGLRRTKRLRVGKTSRSKQLSERAHEAGVPGWAFLGNAGGYGSVAVGRLFRACLARRGVGQAATCAVRQLTRRNGTRPSNQGALFGVALRTSGRASRVRELPALESAGAPGKHHRVAPGPARSYFSGRTLTSLKWTRVWPSWFYNRITEFGPQARSQPPVSFWHCRPP